MNFGFLIRFLFRKVDDQLHQERKIRDMMRRTHPKSNQDFAVLYNELDAWRKAEIHKIKVNYFVIFSLRLY
jgi:GrpB-like predicted nucleotidyltransferase (UPF0157 family)